MEAAKTKKIMVYFDDECLKKIEEMEKRGINFNQFINDKLKSDFGKLKKEKSKK